MHIYALCEWMHWFLTSTDSPAACFKLLLVVHGYERMANDTVAHCLKKLVSTPRPAPSDETGGVFLILSRDNEAAVKAGVGMSATDIHPEVFRKELRLCDVTHHTGIPYDVEAFASSKIARLRARKKAKQDAAAAAAANGEAGAADDGKGLLARWMEVCRSLPGLDHAIVQILLSVHLTQAAEGQNCNRGMTFHDLRSTIVRLGIVPSMSARTSLRKALDSDLRYHGIVRSHNAGVAATIENGEDAAAAAAAGKKVKEAAPAPSFGHGQFRGDTIAAAAQNLSKSSSQTGAGAGMEEYLSLNFTGGAAYLLSTKQQFFDSFWPEEENGFRTTIQRPEEEGGLPIELD